MVYLKEFYLKLRGSTEALGDLQEDLRKKESQKDKGGKKRHV